MTNEILLKMNLLGGMDTYVREVIGDDDLTDFWNMYGVPDGADEEMLKEIAEDEENFRSICEALGKIVTIIDEDEDF